MHEVLVYPLGGLSLPRKSVVSLTDHPDMPLDVYNGRKNNNATDQVISVPDLHLALTCITQSIDFALYLKLCVIDKHHTLNTCSVSHCK